MADRPDEEADEAALRARLGQLSSSLDARPDARPKPAPSGGGDTQFGAMGMGLRVVSELVAGVVVGGGLGYLLDKWLHTKPVFLALFVVLGIVGGFWNVVRTTILPRGPKI